MASAFIAAPIRQPRGPSSNSFGTDPSPPPPSGPPTPDAEFLIRRHNTVSNPRHQPSASVSSTPASTSAFHGARGFRAGGAGVNRLRSGSLSSGSDGGGLSRKGSGRSVVRTEDVVIESGEEGTAEIGGTWGKGLSRQSSLPSRRGERSTALFMSAHAEMPNRPQRRHRYNPCSSTHNPSRRIQTVDGPSSASTTPPDICGRSTHHPSNSAFQPQHSYCLAIALVVVDVQPSQRSKL